MTMKTILTFFLICTIQILSFAQSGGTFVIEKSVIAGGGGSTAGGTFGLDGTIGQSVAGTMSSGGVFSLDSGFWASSAAPTIISGTVTYGNTLATVFVSNVTITGAGSPGVMTTTAPPGANAGQYFLSGFGAGSYTVTPTKTGGVNGAISSFDAGRIALHVAGPPNPQLNPTQLIVADVSNNGAVSSFDAGMIAKFVAGPPYEPPGIGLTSTWRFTPVNRNYASVTTSISGEDFTALLMGEVSGNWVNTGARPVGSRQLAGGSEQLANVGGFENYAGGTGVAGNDAYTPVGGPVRGIAVDLPKLTVPAGKEMIIPVSVQGIAGKGVIAYEFDLRYDPSVIRPQAVPVDLAGTVSRSLTPVVNAVEPGLLRVVVYGPMAINDNGVLLNLRFQAVGAPGSVSPLTWERIIFNEGDPQVMAANGQVEIAKPSD